MGNLHRHSRVTGCLLPLVYLLTCSRTWDVSQKHSLPILHGMIYVRRAKTRPSFHGCLRFRTRGSFGSGRSCQRERIAREPELSFVVSFRRDMYRTEKTGLERAVRRLHHETLTMNVHERSDVKVVHWIFWVRSFKRDVVIRADAPDFYKAYFKTTCPG